MKHTFNVVCVTRYTANPVPYSDPTFFHHDITGEAIVDTERGTCLFQEKEYPIKAVGEGLNSSCMVIYILTEEPKIKLADTGRLVVHHPAFNFWGLYTDTPAEDSQATPEEIQEFAKVAINNPRRYRG